MRSEDYPLKWRACRSLVLSAGEKEGNHLPLLFRALHTAGNRGTIRTLPEYGVASHTQCLANAVWRNGGAFPWGILNLYHMKPLSERPAESRKPLTKFYGITASESELLPLKTDKSTKTQRTTSNGGLSLPCSSSALMNSHTPKLNNRRHIERHTKTGNHKRFPVFLRLFLAFLKNRRIAPRKGKHDTLCLAVFNFRWCGEWKENEEIFQNSRLFRLVDLYLYPAKWRSIASQTDLCTHEKNRGAVAIW